MKLYARKISLRKIHAGQSVLYGKCKARTKKDLTLIRFGYADGLPRIKSKGQFNNRCMDITAVTRCSSRNGEVAVLLNADDVAKKYNTISYEILTKCAIRAQKIYLR